MVYDHAVYVRGNVGELPASAVDLIIPFSGRVWFYLMIDHHA